VKKYIFLDIDGVIATPESIDESGMWALVNSAQDLLGEILQATGAKIVLSSSWRRHDLDSTKEFMKQEGFRFVDDIIGVTIRAYHYLERDKKIHLSIPRGVEIKQWIDTHVHSDNGKNWERKKIGVDYTYLILDDDSDMLLEHKDYFIRTRGDVGLTRSDVNVAIQILNFKQNG
jgi:hypothetical protein